MAAAMSGYALTAKSEPLKHDPWSLQAGSAVPAYEKRSRFEDKVKRTLSNPNGEPRTHMRARRTSMLNGTVTPNHLHFTIVHTGAPDIDPAQHRLVIHGLVKQPLDILARQAGALSDGIAHGVRGMRRQQRADVLARADAGDGAGTARPRVECAEWTGVLLSTLLDEAGVDPAASGSSPKARTCRRCRAASRSRRRWMTR